MAAIVAQAHAAREPAVQASMARRVRCATAILARSTSPLSVIWRSVRNSPEAPSIFSNQMSMAASGSATPEAASSTAAAIPGLQLHQQGHHATPPGPSDPSGSRSCTSPVASKSASMPRVPATLNITRATSITSRPARVVVCTTGRVMCTYRAMAASSASSSEMPPAKYSRALGLVARQMPRCHQVLQPGQHRRHALGEVGGLGLDVQDAAAVVEQPPGGALNHSANVHADGGVRLRHVTRLEGADSAAEETR